MIQEPLGDASGDFVIKNDNGDYRDRRVMHAKFMHELCSLLLHIPAYLHVMRCYNHGMY
jgi:hypothetical protein